MRTTIDLAPDVLAGVEEFQRQRNLGRSEAVNELIRAGTVRVGHAQASRPFRQRTAKLGLRIDVSNVADALEALEGPTHR